MIVGEAPGREEEQKGRPFIGRAGQLLRDTLVEADLLPALCYITNVVSCRPPGNRTPSAKELKACSYWFNAQVEQVKPEFVLLLGASALKGVLGIKGGIKKLRGKPIEKDGRMYFPAFHPAYVLRDPTQEGAFKADISAFAEIVRHGGIPQVEGLNPKVVTNRKRFDRMLEDLQGTVSFDIETTGLYPWNKDLRIRALGFGTRKTQWILPLEEPGQSWADPQLLVSLIDEKLRDCFLVAHNGKFDALWLGVRYGADWDCDFDTMLAHYVIDENSRHGLKFLAQVYFGAFPYEVDAHKCPWEEMVPYLAKDLYYTRKLRFVLGKQLFKETNLKHVFDWIMMPCSRMFRRIEQRGVYIDQSKMDDAERYLRAQREEAKARLDTYGPGVLWTSHKQVGNLLFNKLRIPVVEKTPTGQYATGEGVLKRIDHPVAAALLKFRKNQKLLDGFIEGWKPFLVDGYLHPNFRLHGTVTGRPSCEDPNLQQTPREKRVRSLVTAPPGYVLIEADLSQIELRIAAELANETTMLEIFKRGDDIHWKTAIRELSRGGGSKQEVLRTARALSGEKVNYSEAIRILDKVSHKKATAVDEVWKDLRFKAKAVNFGFLYGMWPDHFQKYAKDEYDIDITKAQAQASYDAYFSLYPQLKRWHEEQKRYARRNGYVRSLTGRKRRLPAAQSQVDSKERRAAERQGINSPVQCYASDHLLMAAIQIDGELRDLAFICGTVHDSMMMWVRSKDVHYVAPRVLEIMKHPKLIDRFKINLQVPIESEVSIGPWGDGKDLLVWLAERKSAQLKSQAR